MNTNLAKIISILEEQKKDRQTDLTLKDLPHPSQMLNLEKLADAIIDDLANGKIIQLIGDYDADGILATTIVSTFFEEIGFKEQFKNIIPDRFKDGYGISKNMIDYALSNKADSILTVDNGITATDAIEYAKKQRLKVYITDHHTCPEKLPNADIIVNPKQTNETFPFTEISGATVAWYLVAMINKKLDLNYNIAKLIDLVAITIISDVMPLNNINIAIFKAGLKLIKKQKRVIYKKIWNDWTIPTLNETTLSFGLIPMINALGRIDDANKGVTIFKCKDVEKIDTLYQEMVSINNKRKEISADGVEEAINYLKRNNKEKDSIIIVKSDNMNEGIIGIVAGRLTEIYNRPAFVFTYNQKAQAYKGSARTAGKINLFNLIQSAKDTVIGFGGHQGAAGLAVSKDMFDKFERDIIKQGNNFNKDDLQSQNNIIEVEDISWINIENINAINRYSPFGYGNEMPKLILKNTQVIIEKSLKNGLHFVTHIKDKYNNTIESLFFNVKQDEFLESIQDKVDIEFNIDMQYNLRNNSYSVKLLSKIIT